MSTRDILRKDYKPVQNADPNKPRIGISSVTLQPDVLLTRQDFLETTKSYMSSLNLNALVIMFIYFGADTQAIRKVAIMSLDKDLKDKLCDFLKSDNDLSLVDEQMEDLDEHLKCFIHVYSHNVRWSRKKMMPAVGNFLMGYLK